ncbi:MAG: DUF1883 domain-containing protein [Planctomycetaceae bacterium]
MNFLHYRLDANAGDVVEVTLDRAANVQLLDPSQFEKYRNRRTYRYYGGHATRSPCRIEVPRTGPWHLVIDLGGAAGTVRASFRLLPASTGAAT